MISLKGIKRITSDSREIEPGTLFVAVRGGTADGHAFIPQAVAQGAVAVVGEDDPSLHPLSVHYYRVADSRLALSELASELYGHPTRGMKVIGVTGTSGKTTTTYLIESILKAAGEKVALVGTVSLRFDGKAEPSTHTTPGPVELQRFLAQVKSQGCGALVMEVSSHALKQKRVSGVLFDGMAFTNLSPEHLDYHPDMEDYFRSKELLFTELADSARKAGKSPVAAINADDSFGRRLLAQLGSSRSLARVEPYSVGSSLGIGLGGIEGEVAGVRIRSALTCAFNASNILAAVTVCRAMGIPKEAIEKGVSQLLAVPGRLERVAHPVIHVLVDYAHKPDALEKVLASLASLRAGQSRLITVFGCGGDRDRLKRPVMGKIAISHSDRVFVTSDNPRTEDPMAIIGQILEGMKGLDRPGQVQVEPDRRKAIAAAIAEARPGDLVLIAGKGHEDYQIIGAKKIHFDDREEAAIALRGR